MKCLNAAMRIANARAWCLASMAVASAIAPLPAAAQFSGSQPAFAERPRAELVQFRDFFRFPFGDDRPRDRGFGNFSPYNPYTPPRPPQAVEATKPPPPRKVETQPTSVVLVIGDSLADWLAYGLEETFADTPEIGIVRKIRPYSGSYVTSRAATRRIGRKPSRICWRRKSRAPLSSCWASMIACRCASARRQQKTPPQGQQTAKGPAANGASLAACRRRMRHRRTANSRRRPRPNRSAGRPAESTSFTPTNGPSFTKSASTT